jgi:hypothetical protein
MIHIIKKVENESLENKDSLSTFKICYTWRL